MSSVLITNLFGIGILLHTYPSRKPTLTLTSHLGAKCWLRGGVGGQFPKRIMILILIQGENLILTLLDTGFRILCQWNLDYGLWITDSDRSWGCLSCIPDSKGHDSTILLQIFAGFRNPNSITWGVYLVINQNQLTNLNILCSSL